MAYRRMSSFMDSTENIPEDGKTAIPDSKENSPANSENIDYSKAKTLPLYKAAISATWAAFSLGVLIGWASPCQPQLQHVKNTTVPAHVLDNTSMWFMNLTDLEMSLVGSLLNGGALFGALSGGTLMDLFGRQQVLLMLSAPYTLSWLLVVVAVHPSMLYIGRLVGGFAGGVSSVVAPSYISEITIPSVRGTLGFFFQLQVVLGILVVSLFGLALDWRLISAIAIIFPLIQLLSMIFIPESPYYLLKKGKKTEALAALEWLRGPDFDKCVEIDQMEDRAKNDQENRGTVKDMFKLARTPFLIAASLMVFQQMSGINAALFNATFIFQSTGSTLDPLVSNVLLNVTQVAASLFAAYLVEKLGRKTLFATSEFFMAVSMVGLGVFFYYSDNESPVAASLSSWLPLTSLISFIFFFGIGAGPMPWLMLAELMPSRFKGPGSSLAAFTNWFLAFVVTASFVSLQKAIGNTAVYSIFAVFCLLGFVFAIFKLPETKGKTPAEIEQHFGLNLSSSPNTNQVDPKDQA